jgi:hypothetical protein
MLGIIFQVTEVERSRPPRATCLSPCGNCYLAAVIVLIASLSWSTSGVDVRIIPSSYLFFLEIPFTDLNELAAVKWIYSHICMYNLHKVHAHPPRCAVHAEDEKSLVPLGSAL